MRRVLSILLFLSLAICFTGCGTSKDTPLKNADTSQVIIDKKSDSKDIFERITTWEAEMPSTIPVPNGSKEFVIDRYTLNCKGMTQKDFADYKHTLESSGFKRISSEGDINYTYVKANIYLSILDQTLAGEPYNEIRTSYYTVKTDNELQSGELTLSQAKVKIEEYIKSIKNKDNAYYERHVNDIHHVDIPLAWDKMKLQAFNVYGTGTFLIQNAKVIPAFLFGDPQVVDIDNDGSFELVVLSSFGSGIYRINILVYKNGEVYAGNCFIPHKGYIELGLEKIDNETVKLRGVEYIADKREFTTDYGKLRIEKHGNLNKLLPENDSDFLVTSLLLIASLEHQAITKVHTLLF